MASTLEEEGAFKVLAPDIRDILRHASLQTFYAASPAPTTPVLEAEKLIAWLKDNVHNPAAMMGFHSTLYDFGQFHDLLPEQYKRQRKSRGPIFM